MSALLKLTIPRAIIKAWLEKARRDLVGAQRLASELPDLAIFHCQQSAEKAIKALLVLYDQEPRKTHNIDTLIRQASAFRPELISRLDDQAI